MKTVSNDAFEKLNVVFREMRKESFIARKNFMRCSSCALEAIAQESMRRTQLGRMVNGFVLYHRQNTAHAKECGELFLRFGSTDDSKKSDVEIGQTIVNILTKNDILFSWNGEADSCIILN